MVLSLNKINIMKFLIDRLKEPSTFRGLAVVLGIVGVQLSPEQTNAITGAVAALIGLIEIFRVEKKSE